MLEPRLIPILQLSDGKLVKTTRFGNPMYLGDPVNALRVFNDLGADELIVIDITASASGSSPDLELLSRLAEQARVPLAYGGGVRSVAEACKIVSLGFEKLLVQSLFEESPKTVSEIVHELGSQAIVASVDLRFSNESGKYEPFFQSGQVKSTQAARELIFQIIDLGVGEILLTDVDREGTREGARVNAMSALTKGVNIPAIANGGVNSIADFRELIDGGFDAVAAGSWFLFRGSQQSLMLSYPSSSAFGFQRHKLAPTR